MKLNHHSRTRGTFASLTLGLIGWSLNSCAPILDTNHPDQAPDINYKLTELKDDQFVGSIPAIDQIVEARIGNTFHGAAIAVVCNGKVVYMKGYGNAHIDPDGSAPFTKNTVGAIGSVSKTLTAMAVMKLVEMKKINLDASIDTYFGHSLPANWDDVTVRDLLCHKGGFERHLRPFQNGNAGPLKPGFLSPEQVDASLSEDHASQHPRHAIWEFLLSEQGSPDPDSVQGLPWADSYSNLGYLVLGAIIDNVTRESSFDGEAGYEPFVWSLFAGAKDAAITPVLNHVWRQHDIPKLATGYASNGLPAVRNCGDVWCSGWEGPAGGWSMTIGDFARVALALMDNQIISEESLNTMRSNQNNGYGLGLIRNNQGPGTYGHNGLIDGFRSQMTIWPNENIAVVGFVNQDRQGLGSIVKDVGEWWIDAKKNGTLPSVQFSELDRRHMKTKRYQLSHEFAREANSSENPISIVLSQNSQKDWEDLRKQVEGQRLGKELTRYFEVGKFEPEAFAATFFTILDEDSRVGLYQPSLKQSNLIPESKGRWAYGSNTGWLNGIWNDAGHKGVSVSHYHLGGLAWSGNFGWLDLGDCEPENGIRYSNKGDDFGVNLDMVSGQLRGYAYGGNVGWVKFEIRGNPQLDLTTGCMSGYAWSSNTGWIDLAPREGSIGWKLKHFAPLPDEDNDALPDPWEMEQVGNITELSGLKDTDIDGQSDYFEYLGGTDPKDPKSILALKLKPNGAGFDLSWSSQADRLFSLFSSEDLKHWNSVPEVDKLPGSAGETTIEISQVEGTPRLFWKIKPSLPMTP